jgi:hypothetical protein
MGKVLEHGGKTSEGVGKLRSARAGAHMYYAAWTEHQPDHIGNLPIPVSGNVVDITRYKDKGKVTISYCLQVSEGVLDTYSLPSQFWLVLSENGGWVGEYEDDSKSQRRSIPKKTPDITQQSLW